MAMSPFDWAFDVPEFFRREFADRFGFILDEEQRYPDRLTGTYVSGGTRDPVESRAVIIPKPVNFDNANRFRRWVAVSRTHWEGMTARPAGWRFFVLMVGLLPDGSPWWAALYDEQVLANNRDLSEQMGNFYRFDPGLTDPAIVGDWDKDRGAGYPGTTRAAYRLDTPHGKFVFADAGEFVAGLWDYARGYGANGEGPEDPITGRIDVSDSQMSVHITE